MDFTRRRTIYNACNPEESLPPGDTRNLDFDKEKGDVRGGSWVERLATQITLSDKPTCTLFTGLPGSGKSTELRRLEEYLSRADQGAYLVVRIDAQEHLDLGVPVDLLDIIALLVHETERRVLALEGHKEDDALKDGYLTRLSNWVTQTDVDFSKVEGAIPGGVKLVAELRTRETFRQRMRGVIARNLSSFLAEARSTLQGLEKRAQIKDQGGIVIIFDSLEKLRGTGASFHDVLYSAERLFSGGAPYLRLPVHLLYTVPPALYTRIQGIQFMPVVKLRFPNGDREPHGWAAMRQLVRRRIPDTDLHEILGDAYEQRLEQVLTMSGGYPRELVQILRALVAVTTLPVADLPFQRILGERRAAYQNSTSANAYDWLAQVHRHHQLLISDDEHRRIADEIISNNGVLHYWNGESWWGLHPAVAAIPGVQEAIQKAS